MLLLFELNGYLLLHILLVDKRNSSELILVCSKLGSFDPHRFSDLRHCSCTSCSLQSEQLRYLRRLMLPFSIQDRIHAIKGFIYNWSGFALLIMLGFLVIRFRIFFAALCFYLLHIRMSILHSFCWNGSCCTLGLESIWWFLMLLR